MLELALFVHGGFENNKNQAGSIELSRPTNGSVHDKSARTKYKYGLDEMSLFNLSPLSKVKVKLDSTTSRILLVK